MTLATQERERIAHDLIIHLYKADEQLSNEEWKTAWLEEMKRRETDLLEGHVERHDGKHMLAELKAKYTVK